LFCKTPLLFAALSSLALLANCATVTRGTKDVLIIESSPAGAQVQTSNGLSCSSTPCTLKMPRRSDLVVSVSKRGCKTHQVAVTHKTADSGAAGVAGNVLVGGVIGLAIDAGTGASQELVPNPVSVALDC
jgi:hypothetical protein